ncbi:HEPN domain-containing protein [Dyadobacter sp. CY345]|uniref:HEPN domain-containing protein n=1 Tax=Dyadobacter sp. CY345 TaxID=2909335 RepID=UPI001F1D457F|nr:HEPN domain-containing protein [Dyadobacter sp. CY345]MCF2446937.1 HEPN domain-containing protein [Dyadobacter sp. CY345]
MRYTTSSEEHQYPVWISPEEMASPADFVRNFCDSWKLSDCRFYLWQMLSNSISYEFTHIEASAGGQIFFFENIMAMIESVYLLNTETEKSAINGNIAPSRVQDSDNLSEISKEDLLDKIVCIIRETAPTDKIFLISSRTDQSKRPKLDFVVLTESTDTKSTSEYEADIKNLTYPMAAVEISIFKTSYFNSIVENGGGLYFSLVLQKAELVFDSGKQKDFIIPISKNFDRAQLRFDYFHKRAVSFLKTSEAHLRGKEYELTAFSCHQAVEHTLNALLFCLMGIKNKTHNLKKLLGLSSRVITKLQSNFFEDENQTDLLPVLQSAYIKARYSEKFTVDSKQAGILLSKTEQLLILVKQAVEEIKNSYGSTGAAFTLESSVDKEDPGFKDQVSSNDSICETYQPFLKSFFDFYEPEDFKRRFFHILQAYSQNDYYRQSSPSDVLFTMEKLGELIFAAKELYPEHFTINYLKNEDAGKNSKSTDFFTLGELSSFEQQNPLQIIAEFFAFKTYDQWDECLKHICFFALCSDDPTEAGFREDTMTILGKVLRLVNACDIIYASFGIN